MEITLFSIAGLVLSITCFSLAIIILISGKTFLQKLWAMLNVVVGLWGVSAFVIGGITERHTALVVWRLAHVAIAFIPVLMLHVVFQLCGIKAKKLLYFAYIQGFIFSILSLTSRLFISNVRFVFNSFYYDVAGPLFYPFFAIWMFLVGYAHFKLFVTYTHAKGVLRTQILYFFAGAILGFSGGGTNFFPAFGMDIYPFGNFTIPIYSFIVTYAIVRHRLMDIRVAITFASLFLFIYTAVLGLPFYVGYRTKSWVLATSCAVIFATIGPMIYRILQRKAANMLLSEQRRYQKILVQAASGMAREHNLNRLSKLIVYIVKRAVRINFAAIIIDDRELSKYRLKAIRDGFHGIADVSFSYEQVLINYLKKKKEPLLYEELPYELRKSLNFPLRVSLIVPSFIENRLLGFLFLGDKLNRQTYTQDDINVFKILSHQTALAIENCFFFDEFKKAQERIFTAEKLASIGGMADGVAHQIKNRLNHFSIASGEMKYEIMDFIKANPKMIEDSPELKNTLEYLAKISDSLVNNVKRTDDIIKGILHFARVEEKETFFSHFSLQESIDLSVGLLKVKHETEDVPLTINSGSSDTIHGVKSQITEAIYNLLDNAFEATQEKRTRLEGDEKKAYKPSIELKVIQESHVSRVEVFDNGIGIKEEDIHKIFAPFFTTKSSYKSGTGIGMYVVKRMIEENHNGKVWFDSEYMQGTRIFIELPKRK